MKAVIWTKYGPADALQLREVEKPSPKEDEVRIKIHAASVTAGDCEMRSLQLPFFLAVPMHLYIGLEKPSRITVLGQELAGEIESVGQDVKLFKEGDPVFATTGFGLAAYAEFKCMPERPRGMEGVLALKPANLTYEEAAAVPIGGLEALHFLRKGNIRSGQKVLINGAGGSIGSIAVQLARHYGAEVTGVDSSGKLDMLRSIGAQHVIDYTQEDFTQNGQTYDIIFDVVGKSPFSRSLRSLKPDGRYLLANPKPSQMVRGRWISLRNGKQVIYGAAGQKTADLVTLKELVEAGVIQPVVDRHYTLEQAAEAHRYVESGRKKGNVVLRVA